MKMIISRVRYACTGLGDGPEQHRGSAAAVPAWERESRSLEYDFSDSHFICFPYETRRTGIYASGTVRAPMDMESSAEDGAGAMMKAIQCVESVKRGEAVHPRSGTTPGRNFIWSAVPIVSVVPKSVLLEATMRLKKEPPYPILHDADGVESAWDRVPKGSSVFPISP